MGGLIFGHWVPTAQKAERAIMPISPIGQNSLKRRRKSTKFTKGFTLVEILAVLLIIGMMTGAVVMNLPAPKKPLDTQARLLAARISTAAQAGLVSGHTVGIVLHENGYDIVIYANDNWNVIETFDYGLESSPALELTLNAAKVDLKQAEKIGIPVIRYDTTGLGTPFTLELTHKSARFIITGKVDGSISAEPKS